MSIGSIQFQHTLSMHNISQLNDSSLQKNDIRDNHILEGENKIKKVSIYSWSTYFMICYILRYIICYNKKILMEMYIYKKIHFMYEVWYMYVFSRSEGREGASIFVPYLSHGQNSIIYGTTTSWCVTCVASYTFVCTYSPICKWAYVHLSSF